VNRTRPRLWFVPRSRRISDAGSGVVPILRPTGLRGLCVEVSCALAFSPRPRMAVWVMGSHRRANANLRSGSRRRENAIFETREGSVDETREELAGGLGSARSEPQAALDAGIVGCAPSIAITRFRLSV